MIMNMFIPALCNWADLAWPNSWEWTRPSQPTCGWPGIFLVLHTIYQLNTYMTQGQTYEV